MNRYAVAFKLGVVGAAFFCGMAVGGQFWLGLILLLAWTLFIMMALPLVVAKVQNGVRFKRVALLHPKE